MAQQTGMGMGIPGGMPAMAVPFSGFPNVNKDAPQPPDDKDAPPPQPPDDTPSKSGKPPCGKRPCTDAAALRSRSSNAPSENIDELEVALRAQVGEIESIMRRIQQLREQQSVTAPVSRDVDPIPMPQYDADSAGKLRPFPPIPEPVVIGELRPAYYQAPIARPQPVGAAPQLQRLPPVRR